MLHGIRTDTTVTKCNRAKRFLADFEPRSKALEDYNVAFEELSNLLNGQPGKDQDESKKPSTRPELKPISYEEIMGNAGMSGFVSFLDAAETEPAASTLADAPDVIVSDTVVESNTVKETTSVQERKTSTVYEPVTVAKTYTVPTQSFQDSRRWRVKRARGVEDGHSLAEQEVYRTLWKIGAPEGEDPEANRTARIGYDRLAGLVRLSWVTVKANFAQPGEETRD